MQEIFINLKRFDVPKILGGLCPVENPKYWIEKIIDESVELGIGSLESINVTYLLPEALIIPAIERLSAYPEKQTSNISIGCQGVYRENIKPGGNFGAFTTNLPAAAAKNMGCTWSMIGHSEERKDKLSIIERYESYNKGRQDFTQRAAQAVDSLINQEILCALDMGVNVLLCIGETAKERGNGGFEEQKPRIQKVLKAQLARGLQGVEKYIHNNHVAIGYEPIWAIGPGKTPPGAEYISFVSSYIKKAVNGKYGFDPTVVYGGGLKEENAAMISGVDTVGGGLVALTRFTGDIGFEVKDLKKIINKYIHAKHNSLS
ncbi:MAG: triose-phosphate isomerase [Tepidanaerobacteraceae bacterium]|nr:triose-phosphate isomerase [Tepidanaerobacteraceae bacterium]